MACSDPSLFRQRFREACQAAGTTPAKLLRAIGVGPKKALAIEVGGLQELDIHWLLRIADKLDVSVGWLTGRSSEPSIAP
jgi:hypothetical protein